VAKRLTSRYVPYRRGWIKTNNPSYWRGESEIEAVRRSDQGRRQLVRVRLSLSGGSGQEWQEPGDSPRGRAYMHTLKTTVEAFSSR